MVTTRAMPRQAVHGPRPSHGALPRRVAWVTLIFAIAWAAWLTEAQATGLPEDVSTLTECPPAAVAVRTHRYRMSAKARPLLFWIGRDDVGEARAVWRRNGDSIGYELLIGSDPRKAPMKINRWGYIAEQLAAGQACVVGVMKQSNDASVDEARARLASEARDGRHVFKAIRASATATEERAGVSTVAVERDLTLHDLPALLAAVEAPPAAVRSVHLPAGTRPGFLISLAELVHTSVENYRTGTRPAAPLAATYVYNGILNDLTLRRSERLREFRAKRRTWRNVVRASFESRNRKTGEVSRFDVVYGLDGPLAEIPLHATYQPNWWFHVELALDDVGPS